MKLKVFGREDTKHEIICESFLASEVSSFEELISLFREYQEKYKGFSILMTLDDLSQAEYTSMHATISQGLDDTEGHDLSTIDSAAFEGGEHIGYLSTKSEFFIRRENFESKAKNISFADARNRGLTLDDEELAQLESIHSNPMAFLDGEILIKVVPVDKSYMAISAFPNGYFSSDLSPFENCALARQLHDRYGYELFGVGASLLGFIRSSPLSESEALLLAADLAFLYNKSEPDSSVAGLAHLATMNKVIFLKYIDYLGR